MKSTAFSPINHFFASSLIIGLLMLSSFSSRAYHEIDSLRIAYDYSENSHEQVLLQIQIADAYFRRLAIDTAIFEYRKAIGIIHPDSIILKAKTLYRLGHAYDKIEDVPNMIATYQVSNKLYRQDGDQEERVGRTFALIGRSYYAGAQYDSAMVYYMKSKAVYESENIIHEDYGYLLHFIGSVFKRQGDDAKACEYYNQEIEYGRKHRMRTVEAEGMYLSGICIDDPREALENYRRCKAIYEEEGRDRLVSLMHTLISSCYSELEMNDSAFYYQKKCIKDYREMAEISHLASALSHGSSILIDMGRFNEAKSYLKEAEEVVARAGIKTHLRYTDIYKNYYRLNLEQGNFKSAVEYQSLMYAYRDSARDQEHQDAISEMEKIYQDDKQKAEIALKDKDLAVERKETQLANEEADSQSFIKNIFMIGGLLLLGLGVFVYIKYRESQKQKKVISEQKREVEFQKELVDAKNKDIMDSMVYASSIQKAIITSEDYISKMFPEFFVFYKPRDIVSGDFYWAYQAPDGKRLIAVGDCTGHGVPGAMMSMLGTAFLNEIVIEGKTYDPAEVLNKLRDQVKKALNNETHRDGMDMSFCCIDGDKLTFSGANLPLYILRSGALQELKGNKQPLGHQPFEDKPFTEESFPLQKDDFIYLFSDGYADQFGGAKGKKYKYKTFREKLIEVSPMSFVQQRSMIDEEFETWKGDLEQLDDVCVLGVRI